MHAFLCFFPFWTLLWKDHRICFTDIFLLITFLKNVVLQRFLLTFVKFFCLCLSTICLCMRLGEVNWKQHPDVSKFRSSHQRCSIKRTVLKNFAIFTGKKLCLFLLKSGGLKTLNLIRKRLQRWRCPMNIAKSLGTSICKQLLLNPCKRLSPSLSLEAAISFLYSFASKTGFYRRFFPKYFAIFFRAVFSQNTSRSQPKIVLLL